MKNSSKNYLINFLLILAFTIFGLWFALKDNYVQVVELIKSLPLPYLLLIMSGGILYGIFAGLVLTNIVRRNKKDFKYRQGIVNALIGLFFCGITPSATGGQFVQAYCFKKQGLSYQESASVLWADFIIYQSVMMIYVTILFFLKFNYFLELIGPWFLGIVVGYIINLFVIGILWTMALFPKLYVFLSQKVVVILAKVRIVKDKDKTLESWGMQVQGFTQEIKKMSNDKKMIVKCVILSIIRMTIQFSLPFVIMRCIGIEIGFDFFVDTLALSSFVLMSNAFIPLPGASGGTEVVFTALFTPMVKESAIASGVMVLWRFSTFHMLLIVGAILFLSFKKYYAKIEMKMEQEG